MYQLFDTKCDLVGMVNAVSVNSNLIFVYNQVISVFLFSFYFFWLMVSGTYFSTRTQKCPLEKSCYAITLRKPFIHEANLLFLLPYANLL